jgi:hypothetical protein
VVRIQEDAGSHPVSNRTAWLYQNVKAGVKPILQPHLVINTDGNLEGGLLQCLEFMKEGNTLLQRSINAPLKNKPS